jgi:hypothetical protein
MADMPECVMLQNGRRHDPGAISNCSHISLGILPNLSRLSNARRIPDPIGGAGIYPISNFLPARGGARLEDAAAGQ